MVWWARGMDQACFPRRLTEMPELRPSGSLKSFEMRRSALILVLLSCFSTFAICLLRPVLIVSHCIGIDSWLLLFFRLVYA